MATIVGASLSRAGVAGEWVVITSSLVAAMAGITWYLIFMRWSYRHSYGRSSELRKTTHIEADELGVYLTRGTIRTRISWDGIDSIATDMKFSRLHVLDRYVIEHTRWRAPARSLSPSTGSQDQVPPGVQQRGDLTHHKRYLPNRTRHAPRSRMTARWAHG